MKYIKYFENAIENSKNILKYVVWLSDGEGDILEIFELPEKRELVEYALNVTIHYTYSIKLKKFIKNKYIKIKLNLEDSSVEESLLYQSNNLQDCLNFIPILADSYKFNI